MQPLTTGGSNRVKKDSPLLHFPLPVCKNFPLPMYKTFLHINIFLLALLFPHWAFVFTICFSISPINEKGSFCKCLYTCCTALAKPFYCLWRDTCAQKKSRKRLEDSALALHTDGRIPENNTQQQQHDDLNTKMQDLALKGVGKTGLQKSAKDCCRLFKYFQHIQVLKRPLEATVAW